jgi:hypothetical protein
MDLTELVITCCHIENKTTGCENDATWHIAFGGGPDDYTLACTDHLGTLMDAIPSPFFTVTRNID